MTTASRWTPRPSVFARRGVAAGVTALSLVGAVGAVIVVRSIIEGSFRDARRNAIDRARVMVDVGFAAAGRLTTSDPRAARAQVLAAGRPGDIGSAGVYDPRGRVDFAVPGPAASSAAPIPAVARRALRIDRVESEVRGGRGRHRAGLGNRRGGSGDRDPRAVRRRRAALAAARSRPRSVPRSDGSTGWPGIGGTLLYAVGREPFDRQWHRYPRARRCMEVRVRIVARRGEEP